MIPHTIPRTPALPSYDDLHPFQRNINRFNDEKVEVDPNEEIPPITPETGPTPVPRDHVIMMSSNEE
jgi:hypothetical protein